MNTHTKIWVIAHIGSKVIFEACWRGDDDEPNAEFAQALAKAPGPGGREFCYENNFGGKTARAIHQEVDWKTKNNPVRWASTIRKGIPENSDGYDPTAGATFKETA